MGSSSFIVIVSFAAVGITCLSIVLAFQLGLSQWGSKPLKSSSAASISPTSGRFNSSNGRYKRRFDIPIIWTISCLLFLNCTAVIYAVIWHGDTFYLGYNGKIFCDVFVRLQVFASIGVLCGVTATTRNLCMIISPKGPPIYFQTKWKRNLIDTAICVIFPIIQNPIIYIVQSRRYMIVENTGCNVVVSNSWVSLLVYHIWFAIWAFIAAIYAVLTCYYCYRRKKDFSDILSCTGSGLTAAQFTRLMTFSAIIICGQLPVSLYLVALRSQGITRESYSFKEVHLYWDMIGFVYYDATLFLDRWLFIAFAYVAFLVFGVGRDAQLVYMKVLDILRVGWIVRSIGRGISKVFGKVCCCCSGSRNKDKSGSSIGSGSLGKDLRVLIPQYQHNGYNLGSSGSGSGGSGTANLLTSRSAFTSPQEKFDDIDIGDGSDLVYRYSTTIGTNGIPPHHTNIDNSIGQDPRFSPGSPNGYEQQVNAQDTILDSWSPSTAPFTGHHGIGHGRTLDLEGQQVMPRSKWGYVLSTDTKEHDENNCDTYNHQGFQSQAGNGKKSGLVVQVESCSSSKSSQARI